MSERPHKQFLPGDEFTIRLDLENVRAHLLGAGVRFRHEGDGVGSIVAQGTAADVEDHGSYGSGRMASMRMVLRVPVPGGLDPGIYRPDRVWVETVGGRSYEYEDEDLVSLRETFAFEVLAEPDVRPELRLTYAG